MSCCSDAGPISIKALTEAFGSSRSHSMMAGTALASCMAARTFIAARLVAGGPNPRSSGIMAMAVWAPCQTDRARPTASSSPEHVPPPSVVSRAVATCSRCALGVTRASASKYCVNGARGAATTPGRGFAAARAVRASATGSLDAGPGAAGSPGWATGRAAAAIWIRASARRIGVAITGSAPSTKRRMAISDRVVAQSARASARAPAAPRPPGWFQRLDQCVFGSRAQGLQLGLHGRGIWVGKMPDQHPRRKRIGGRLARRQVRRLGRQVKE